MINEVRFLMTKSVLYVTEPGLMVHCTGKRVLVKRGKTVVCEARLEEIERVVLCSGGCGVTSPAAIVLMDAGIEVSLFASSGGFRGYLSPAMGKSVNLRLAQYLTFTDPARRLDIARAMVAQKIANGDRLLARFARNHSAFDPSAMQRRMAAARRSAESAASLESLLGYEGTAAAAYFAAFGQMLRGEFAFTVRSRRPPRDPANALLSLAYTLLTAEATHAIAGAGLDPALGMLHTPEDGRPSLGLDLTEEFRAAVGDRLVLHLVNNRVVSAGADFEDAANGGTLLTPTARKRFYAAYEQRMTEPFQNGSEPTRNLRECLRHQARLLAHCFRTGEAYAPFVFRG